MAKHLGRRNDNMPRTTGDSMNLLKFPRTRHLVDAGGNAVTRDDLLMTKKEAKEFLKGKVISVEEKIDGANIGFSLDEHCKIRAQNRSHFVSSQSHKQFSTLDNWISQNSKSLLQILSDGRYILYGEWVYAKHSIFYTKLPNYFIAFDIYDSMERSFLSRRGRDAMLQGTGINTVPLVVERQFQDPDELLPYLDTESSYYDGPVEGLYLRLDSDAQQPTGPDSKAGILLNRSKIVRPDFLQQIEEQWTRQRFTKNICEYYQ